MITIDDVYPVNPDYGLYQGVPIARHYIDRFVASVARELRGKILEFGRPTYAETLDCVYDIIDIEETNPLATICADICDPDLGPARAGEYDHILCTAVLQLVPDPRAAIDNMHRMLKPGGSLVIAEKSVSRMDPWSGPIDRWRFTPRGMEVLLRPFARADVRGFGNVYAMCAYLLGLPAASIEPEKLEFNDPEHPIVAAARAWK